MRGILWEPAGFRADGVALFALPVGRAMAISGYQGPPTTGVPGGLDCLPGTYYEPGDA